MVFNGNSDESERATWRVILKRRTIEQTLDSEQK
jgi:hypothetical protein